MRPGITLQLALLGRGTDRLRLWLTIIATFVAGFVAMAGVNVVLIPSDSAARYRSELLNQSGLHPGVVITLAALLVPVTLFVGQCALVGAPERARRLTRMRLAGGSAHQVAAIGVVESVVGASAGATSGAGAFWSLSRLVPNRRDASGRLPWPTDVSIPLWIYMVTVVAVAVLTGLASGLALRTVRLTPLGAVPTTKSRLPTVTGPVLLGVGAFGLSVVATTRRSVRLGENASFPLIALLSVLFVAIGLTISAASIGQYLGGFVASRTRRPALLLAARRIMMHPHRTMRPSAAVALAILIAAAVQQTQAAADLQDTPSDGSLRTIFSLLNGALVIAMVVACAGVIVVVAESIVSQRRLLSSLVAAGVPRSTLRWAAILEIAIGLVPATLLAAPVGVVGIRLVFSTEIAESAGGAAIPWVGLAALSLGAVCLLLIATWIGLLFLSSSTELSELRTS